jgi:hypothetical protein
MQLVEQLHATLGCKPVLKVLKHVECGQRKVTVTRQWQQCQSPVRSNKLQL